MRILTKKKQDEILKLLAANEIIAIKGLKAEYIDSFCDNSINVVCAIGGIKGLQKVTNTLKNYLRKVAGMTFKEFNEWCNRRACDGCWGMATAIYCIEIGRKINALPFWKREKEWNKVKDFVEKEIVQVIEEKMALIKEGEQE